METRILEHAFPAVGEDDWRALAHSALKGADFAQTLTTTSDEGIRFGPVYPRAAGRVPVPRANPEKPWTVAQRIDDPDADRALAQARDDCANGATGLVLCVGGTPGAYGFGLPAAAGPLFPQLLGSIPLDAVSLRLEGSAMTARALADAVRASASSPARCTVHFGLDPVSAAAFSARDFTLDGRLGEIAGALAGFGFGGTVLQADGRAAHNAGAGEAQELAFVLASLAAYLKTCESAGWPPESVFARTALAVAADQNQMLSIAKIRALRLLHARMQTVCGVTSPVPAHIHAETSYRMLTRRGAETNILRNTIAAFSAGVGGADSIAVLPHTLAHGLPEASARRIARNTQSILMRESHLDHVADPAAGSGGIEALTDALAEKAWDAFREIEREGGIMASLSSGAFQARVSEVRRQRGEVIASGDRRIVGTTLHPADEERPVDVYDARAGENDTTGPRGSRRALVPVRLDAFADRSAEA